MYAYINYQLNEQYNIPMIENSKQREILDTKGIRKKVVTKYRNLKTKDNR